MAINVVTIGGGTGSFPLLRALKRLPNINVSAIVSMTDDGGSNRYVVHEWGMLPFSDIVQCLIALAPDNADPRSLDLIRHRVKGLTGIQDGLRTGNMISAFLQDLGYSPEEALDYMANVLLSIKGQVIPVTYDNATLYAKYANGNILRGESNIDTPSTDWGDHRIKDLWVEPDTVTANPKAVSAILDADYIIIAPGDLYTSILCNIVVPGIREALAQTNAKIIYVMNLMQKRGQTTGLTATEHLNTLVNFMGIQVDLCLVNNVPAPQHIAAAYLAEGDAPVVDNLDDSMILEVVRRDLVSLDLPVTVKGDTLARSLFRHDHDKLELTLQEILI